MHILIVQFINLKKNHENGFFTWFYANCKAPDVTFIVLHSPPGIKTRKTKGLSLVYSESLDELDFKQAVTADASSSSLKYPCSKCWAWFTAVCILIELILNWNASILQKDGYIMACWIFLRIKTSMWFHNSCFIYVVLSLKTWASNKRKNKYELTSSCCIRSKNLLKRSEITGNPRGCVFLSIKHA